MSGYVFKLVCLCKLCCVWRGCCTTVNVLKVLIWKVIGVFVCSWTWQLIAGCSQRAPVVFVCTHVCFAPECLYVGNLSTWHCVAALAALTQCFVLCVYVCARAWLADTARAPMLSPIMLWSCLMVNCSHPGFSACRGTAGTYWNQKRKLDWLRQFGQCIAIGWMEFMW